MCLWVLLDLVYECFQRGGLRAIRVSSGFMFVGSHSRCIWHRVVRIPGGPAEPCKPQPQQNSSAFNSLVLSGEWGNGLWGLLLGIIFGTTILPFPTKHQTVKDMSQQGGGWTLLAASKQAPRLLRDKSSLKVRHRVVQADQAQGLAFRVFLVRDKS